MALLIASRGLSALAELLVPITVNMFLLHLVNSIKSASTLKNKYFIQCKHHMAVNSTVFKTHNLILSLI